jgi:hypothetical protein
MTGRVLAKIRHNIPFISQNWAVVHGLDLVGTGGLPSVPEFWLGVAIPEGFEESQYIGFESSESRLGWLLTTYSSSINVSSLLAMSNLAAGVTNILVYTSV